VYLERHCINFIRSKYSDLKLPVTKPLRRNTVGKITYGFHLNGPKTLKFLLHYDCENRIRGWSKRNIQVDWLPGMYSVTVRTERERMNIEQLCGVAYYLGAVTVYTQILSDSDCKISCSQDVAYLRFFDGIPHTTSGVPKFLLAPVRVMTMTIPKINYEL
jgi:hypothetical protein